MEKITLLLVDDHRLLRESWIGFLNSDDRFRVIGDTGDGIEAIEMVRILEPAIILLDINMSPTDGFEITRQINSSQSSSKVIGVSMYNSIHCAKRLQALGAMGYLTKNSSKEEMIKALLSKFSNLSSMPLCAGCRVVIPLMVLYCATVSNFIISSIFRRLTL